MVSKDTGRCTLAASESDVEPAARLALEMKYALDANRQVKKRNKALQVRFKDICEAQNEQRDARPPAGTAAERREARPACHRAAYRKYMTVPARRSIPNVTKSTGVQTSPDLKKCYQTFPLDRKKGALAGAPAGGAFASQDDGFGVDAKERREEATAWAAGRARTTAALVFHHDEHRNALDPPSGVNCAEPCGDPDAPLHGPARPAPHGPGHRLPGKAAQGRATPDAEEPAPAAHGRVFKTEVASVYAPAASAKATDSAAASQWSLCPAADEEQGRAAHLNGLQDPPGPCLYPECSDQPPQTQAPQGREDQPCPPAVTAGEDAQHIVPHTEVVGLKAQLQVMEHLISSSQETIKVLLGVIQELEKGEAHREG